MYNPLPDVKILALSKLKAFAEDNFNMAKIEHFFFDCRENIVKKGEKKMLVTCILSFSHNAVNSLPNEKFLDRSKFKAFADNKLNLVEKLVFVMGWVENIVGKGENAFPTMFSKGFFLGGR